jgi:predicted transcriptional regulator
MIDIDFLAIEFGNCEPKALVEYKNEHASIQYSIHPSYQALIKLGNKADIPVIACRYSDDYSTYTVTPLNNRAKEYIPEKQIMSELKWVQLLYQIRGYQCPQNILSVEI